MIGATSQKVRERATIFPQNKFAQAMMGMQKWYCKYFEYL